ncbi:MAG TPA: hypothetical protein VFO95_11540 [Gemmatimonadales bacterium]|jgi:hypothetical protein|nr:hypothetical protein [Gemmatimonadales bacterium]
MTTRLEKSLKRELEIDGKPYTITIGPEGVKVTPKGGRKGVEVSWRDILSGSTELMSDLSQSVGGGASDV